MELEEVQETVIELGVNILALKIEIIGTVGGKKVKFKHALTFFLYKHLVTGNVTCKHYLSTQTNHRKGLILHMMILKVDSCSYKL